MSGASGIYSIIPANGKSGQIILKLFLRTPPMDGGKLCRAMAGQESHRILCPDQTTIVAHLHFVRDAAEGDDGPVLKFSMT